MLIQKHVRLPRDLFRLIKRLERDLALPSENAAIVMAIAAGLKHFGVKA